MEPTPVEGFLIQLQTGNKDKKVIYHFYQIFVDMNLNNTLQIKGRWETEMNTDIPQDIWE